MEEMDNFTVNFTTTETSTNSTTHFIRNYLDMCMYGINFLFGLPTHSYVLWLIATGTGSGVASEFFILNLSVSEIIYCLNNVFVIMSICSSDFAILPQFLEGLIFTGRPLFQSLICVERYMAVVHPVIFLKSKPLRYRLICCAVAWIIIVVSCFYCLFIVLSENFGVHNRFFSIQYLLFLSIQLFCLVAVLRALKQSGPGDRRVERVEENHMKRRAFIVILMTTVSMTFMYVPFTITGFLSFLLVQNQTPPWSTGLICYVLAGFVQPVLYLHRAQKLICLYKS